MCHKTLLSILVKEVSGNCIVNICLGLFFYVFTSEASSSLAGNLHSTHSINISGASSVLFSSMLVLAGHSSGSWYWWSTAATSYLFCMACEANEGFYSFKWFLKVHNTWKLHEIQISVFISCFVGTQPYLLGNRLQARDSSSLSLGRKSLQPPELVITTHVLHCLKDV